MMVVAAAETNGGARQQRSRPPSKEGSPLTVRQDLPATRYRLLVNDNVLVIILVAVALLLPATETSV